MKSYKEMIEDGNPLTWVGELFSSRYGDGASLAEYSPLGRNGETITIRFLPYHEMFRKFGDAVGYREKNDIWVAQDYEGRALRPEEQAGVILHEISAGYGHFRSDAEAQRLAEITASGLGAENPLYLSILSEVRAQTARLENAGVFRN